MDWLHGSSHLTVTCMERHILGFFFVAHLCRDETDMLVYFSHVPKCPGAASCYPTNPNFVIVILYLERQLPLETMQVLEQGTVHQHSRDAFKPALFWYVSFDSITSPNGIFSQPVCWLLPPTLFFLRGGCSTVLPTKYPCCELYRNLLAVLDSGDLKEIMHFFDPPSGTQIKVSLPAQWLVKMKVVTLYMEMSCF